MWESYLRHPYKNHELKYVWQTQIIQSDKKIMVNPKHTIASQIIFQSCLIRIIIATKKCLDTFLFIINRSFHYSVAKQSGVIVISMCERKKFLDEKLINF